MKLNLPVVIFAASLLLGISPTKAQTTQQNDPCLSDLNKCANAILISKLLEEMQKAVAFQAQFEITKRKVDELNKKIEEKDKIPPAKSKIPSSTP